MWRLKQCKFDAWLILLDVWLHSRDEIHEAGQRLIRLVPHMAELNHHLLFELVINDGDSEGRGFIGQEASIVSALQVKLQVWGGKKTRKPFNDSKKTDCICKPKASFFRVQGLCSGSDFYINLWTVFTQFPVP